MMVVSWPAQGASLGERLEAATYQEILQENMLECTEELKLGLQ